MTRALSEIIKEIEHWQTKIEQAKIERAKLEGRLSGLLKSLKEQFGIDCFEAAEEQLEKIGEELEEATKEIQRQYETIKNKYDI